MRHIIHCVPSLGEKGGGPPRSVSQLCNELCCQEMNVGVVTAKYEDDPMVYLDPKIEVTQLDGRGSGCGRLRGAGFGAALTNRNLKVPISLIHQHGLWLRSSHESVAFASKRNIPLVLAARGMLEPWAINNSKWKKKLAWMLYQKKDLKRVTAFHATAESEAESIRRLGFKQPIAVIPNGVELPELNQSSVINHQISDKKTALFLSRINPKKGLPMLLDVWRKLAPENWRLVIAGNDDSNHLPVLERKIAELGLSDQVEIVGPLFGVDKEAAFHNADLFVLPSYSENFGIVVTEALGYHVPVLTTTGCPWQELETHDCGWWVDPTPEGVLAGLQQALMATPDRLSEMGMRGRKLVEEKYQWPGIAERMAAFYEWLINGGKQPEFVVKWLE